MRRLVSRWVTGVLVVLSTLYLVGEYTPYNGVMGAFLPGQPHAHGHDALVVRIDHTGGMDTQQGVFSHAPVLVVAGDGTAYADRGGTSTGIVRPVVTFHLDEHDLQALLKRAAHDGLLADHTYTRSGVSDGGSTDVVITTSNGRWHTSAYALEPGWGFTGTGRLWDFVSEASSTASSAVAVPYYPRALEVNAQPGSAASPKDGWTARPWPTARSGVSLADAQSCVPIRDPATVRMLTTRTSPLYVDSGTAYTVAARVSLPGDSCADSRHS